MVCLFTPFSLSRCYLSFVEEIQRGIDEVRHDLFVREGRDVPEGPGVVGGDLAQEPAHDLAAAGLGQGWHDQTDHTHTHTHTQREGERGEGRESVLGRGNAVCAHVVRRGDGPDLFAHNVPQLIHRPLVDLILILTHTTQHDTITQTNQHTSAALSLPPSLPLSIIRTFMVT